MAYWQGMALGLPALILFFGIAVVSVLAVVTLLLNRQTSQSEPEQGSAEHHSLLSSFNAQQTPSLIVKHGKPIFANAAYQVLATELGVDVIGEAPPSVERLFAKKDRAASAAIFRLHHTTSANDMGEETIRTLGADGKYRAFTVQVSSIEDGQLWQVVDKTKDSGAGDLTLLSEAPIGLFSVATDGTIIKTNTVLRGWLGFETGAEPVNMQEFIESPEALLDSLQTPGRTVRADTRLITQKGVVSPVVMMGGWHEMDSGDVYASVAVYGHSGLGAHTADIAELPAGQDEALADTSIPGNDPSGDETSMVGAPFGVVKLDSTDLDNAIISTANVAMADMQGQEVVAGSLFKALFVDNPESSAFITAGVNAKNGPVGVHLNGVQERPVDVYFSALDDNGCVAYIVDVSTRKALEDKLGQSQKMQIIGQLAGGIAHDFNNLLTAIRGNADILLERHPVGDPSYQELQQINQVVSRATGLVRKLLAFSRQQTLQTVVLDVTDTLSELTFLLQDVLVDRVKLEVIHGRGLLPIQADKGQFETVLINLCVNARDAMLDQGGGMITLKSAKVSDDELRAQNIELRQDGGYVRFDVIDTGTGMDKATQEKIFEPFFTTKPQGKGTGLGLATVYGIIQQSGGHLRVDSVLGTGTTFSIYMPTATGKFQVPIKPKPAIAAARQKPSDLAGQGSILFVEDEVAIRIVAAKTLRKRGYTVIEAENGREAYDILQTGEHDFDLMISDVVMPDMDGPTLLKKARDILEGTHIVFISGFAEDHFSDLLAEEPDVIFMQKPFGMIDLARKVKSILGDED
ncbi:MAG: response regulator [Robiginitomaculum sp.]|nr:response regulator [Robiginitomaculum sp.]